MKTFFARLGLALVLLGPLAAGAQIMLSIDIAPPPLPLYAQPPVPGEGYLWTPGYWSWSPTERDYFWVPGTWVLAPNPGDLWTPGYWAFENAAYFWHIGYWGRSVGFYGGLNYGYGYNGSGYQGGRWDGGVFHYNRAVSNVNTRVVHNVYNTAVANRLTHVSFNGGRSGAGARPTAAERQLQAAEHAGPTPDQLRHEHTAIGTPTQRAAGPHGAPQVAATPRLSAFTAPGVERIRGEPVGRMVPPGAAAPEPSTVARQPLRPEVAPRPPVQAPQRAQPQERAPPHDDGRAERPREERPREDGPRKER